MHNEGACALLILLFIVSFIIGINCLLLGCNVHLVGACPSYQYIHGVVYDTHIQRKPTKGGYVYEMIVSYHYHNNASCIYIPAVYNKHHHALDALAESYAAGDGKDLLVRRDQHRCFEIKDVHDTWIAGMVFMILAGAAILSVLFIVWAENGFTLSCFTTCFYHCFRVCFDRCFGRWFDCCSKSWFDCCSKRQVPRPEREPVTAVVELPNVNVAKTQIFTAVPIAEVEIELA